MVPRQTCYPEHDWLPDNDFISNRDIYMSTGPKEQNPPNNVREGIDKSAEDSFPGRDPPAKG